MLNFSKTGCWDMLLAMLCLEKLDQMILEVPSNLVFYESMTLLQ